MHFCANRAKPLDVAALLPSLLLAQLRIAIGRDHLLHDAKDWVELEQIVRRTPVDVVVVDPSVGGAPSAMEIVALRTRHPSLAVLPYVMLSPESLRTVVELARHGVHQLVLHRFDDDAARLRELVLRQPGDQLTELVLERLTEALGRLPLPLGRAVRDLFRAPQQFQSALDLVATSGQPRRSLYRQLAAAGLASPRTLVQGARVLRAYVYLGDPGALVEDVATKLGYASARILVRHAREVADESPSALRRRLSPEQFVNVLVRLLLCADGALRAEAGDRK
jgi:AraC-like DNA-binding protein